MRCKFNLQLSFRPRNFSGQRRVFTLQLCILIFQVAFLALGFAVIEPGILSAKVVGKPSNADNCPGKGRD